MIKLVFTIILFYPLVLPQAQLPRLTGYVTEQNSGKKRVEGVMVKAAAPARTNTVITGAEGDFTLIFQDMTAGQSVNLLAEKKGWQVVNEAEMRTRIPEYADGQPLKIILCPAQKLELARKEYYEITDRYIAREYEKQMAALDRTKTGWQQKAKELNEHLTSLRKQIIEIAEAYTRTNMDDLTPTEKQAFELFRTGRIEEGIRLRNSMNSVEQLQAAIRKGHQLDSTINVHTRNLKRLATEYSLIFDFKNAERVYQELVDADTTNIDNVFEFSAFLQKQNQYEKALRWIHVALRQAGNNAVHIVIIESNLGILHHTMNNFEAAKKSYQTAQNACQNLLSVYPEVFQSKFADLRNSQAHLYHDMQDFAEEEKAILEAESVWQRLATDNPARYAEGLAKIETNIVRYYSNKQLLSKAKEVQQKALNLFAQLSSSGSYGYELELSAAYMNLGNLSQKEGRLKDAEIFYLKSKDILLKLSDINPSAFEPALIDGWYNIAFCYQVSNKFKDSYNAWASALKLAEKLAIENPAVYEPKFAFCLRAAADLYKLIKDYKKAEECYINALNIYKRQNTGSEDAFANEIAAIKNGLGLLYLETKNYINAEQNYLDAVAIFERLIKLDSVQFLPSLTTIKFNLANIYSAKGNYSAAAEKYMAVLEVWQKLSENNPTGYTYNIGLLYNNLAILYRLSNEYELAQKPAIEAIEIFDKIKEEYPAEYATALESLGDILLFRKSYKLAIDTLFAAMNIWRRLTSLHNGIYDLNIATNLHYQANIYKAESKYADAEQAYTEAIIIMKRLVATDPNTEADRLAETQLELGRNYLLRNNMLGFMNETFAAITIYRRLNKQNTALYGADFCDAVLYLCDFYEHFPLKQINDIRKTLLAEVDSTIQRMPASEEKNRLLRLRKNDLSQLLTGIKSLQQQIENEKNNAIKIALQKKLINERRKLAEEDISGQKAALGKDYGYLAWYMLLNKQFAEAEAAAIKALHPDWFEGKHPVYDKEIEWVYTNLALALLLQGKNKEAETIYKAWKDRPLQYATFKIFFLRDLDKLEKEGITHRDFAGIRALLAN